MKRKKTSKTKGASYPEEKENLEKRAIIAIRDKTFASRNDKSFFFFNLMNNEKDDERRLNTFA